jgi:hypothetical protein
MKIDTVHSKETSQKLDQHSTLDQSNKEYRIVLGNTKSWYWL